MHQGACAVREVDLDTSLLAFRDLPVGVAVWQLRDSRDVRSLRLVGVNPACERELRAPLKFALGKPITESFPKLLDTSIPDRYRQVIVSGKPETFGELVYRDARVPEGVFWIDCFPLPDGCVGVALENITESKRMTQAQGHALQLLHRITVFLNDAPTALVAAQFCIDEICSETGWPVGRFFLSDEERPSRYLPNPVWHLSDPQRFKAFRKATELYELNVTNRLTLEYRTIQGQRAGLTKSVGFKVVENDFLRGVLEFSSESCAPLDEHIFRAISNVGFQLGQVFARERLREQYGRLQEVMLSRDAEHDAISKVLFKGKPSLSATVASLAIQKPTPKEIAASSQDILESTRQMRKNLDELRRLVAKPTVLSLPLALK
jgi:hypothetical protein